jgi:hypothetical protein
MYSSLKELPIAELGIPTGRFSKYDIGINAPSTKPVLINIKLSVLLIHMVILFVFLPITSCSPKSGGIEKSFLEGDMKITDSLAVDASQYPRTYRLGTGNIYTLTYAVEKYMNSIDADMALSISLPQNIEKISGETVWIGTDKYKSILVKIRAATRGNCTVVGVAKNLTNSFVVTNMINIVIEDIPSNGPINNLQ